MKLSIIIPVFNECSTIKMVIDEVNKVNIDKEIIVVDDGSTDGTRQLLQEIYNNRSNIRIICHSRNQGKGTAIRTALKYITGDLAIIQDGDLEYDPNEYLKLIEPIKNNKANVVYGSRFLSSKKVTSFWHRAVNWFLTYLTNLFYSSSLTDMETCYKVFKKEVIDSLDLVSCGFEIEVELTIKTMKKGCKIYEVPISYRGRSYHEGKKINWKDGFYAMWTLIKYRFFILKVK